MGAKSSTTWKYKYNWGGNAGEYYILRWLDKAGMMKKRQDMPVPDDRDWIGFLKIME